MMPDDVIGTMVGTVKSRAEEAVGTAGKTKWAFEVLPAGETRARKWRAWPEVGDNIALGRTYRFKTSVRQGDKAKFFDISDATEVDPDTPQDAPLGGTPAATRTPDGTPGTSGAGAETPRGVALRAAVAARRSVLEFMPDNEHGGLDAEPTRIIVWAREFELYLTSGTSASPSARTADVPATNEAANRATDVAKPEGAQPETAAPGFNPYEFQNLGALMNWAMNAHQIMAPELVKILGIEYPADMVGCTPTELKAAAETIAHYVASKATE
jgi:hypothetical protein